MLHIYHIKKPDNPSPSPQNIFLKELYSQWRIFVVLFVWFIIELRAYQTNENSHKISNNASTRDYYLTIDTYKLLLYLNCCFLVVKLYLVHLVVFTFLVVHRLSSPTNCTLYTLCYVGVFYSFRFLWPCSFSLKQCLQRIYNKIWFDFWFFRAILQPIHWNDPKRARVFSLLCLSRISLLCVIVDNMIAIISIVIATQTHQIFYKTSCELKCEWWSLFGAVDQILQPQNPLTQMRLSTYTHTHIVHPTLYNEWINSMCTMLSINQHWYSSFAMPFPHKSSFPQ